MQEQSTTTTETRHPMAFWANIKPQTLPASLQADCPECGHPTDDGLCFNIRCFIGLYNIQVGTGRDVPEDWLMVEVDKETEAAPAALSGAFAGVAA